MALFEYMLRDVLTSLYQPFWFSVLLSVLFMMVYKTYEHAGLRAAVRQWVTWFRSDRAFRKLFLLTFYTTMLLFRTLLNRNMWANPVSNVIGIWGFYNQDGNFTGEAVENLFLFLPFIFLLFWCFRDKLLCSVRLRTVLWQSMKISFLISASIEFLQLFLRLGTWQLSDLFYNTLGGMLGGLLYWITYRGRHRKK